MEMNSFIFKQLFNIEVWNCHPIFIIWFNYKCNWNQELEWFLKRGRALWHYWNIYVLIKICIFLGQLLNFIHFFWLKDLHLVSAHKISKFRRFSYLCPDGGNSHQLAEIFNILGNINYNNLILVNSLHTVQHHIDILHPGCRRIIGVQVFHLHFVVQLWGIASLFPEKEKKSLFLNYRDTGIGKQMINQSSL